ncbi:MAG: SCO family protein [Alphaproteobacteria bacterium]|nr:SCO family protein [Alphaproteobacteria bacterium]
MNPALKARLKRTAILCAAGLVIGIVIGFFQVHSQNPGRQSPGLSPLAGVKIGGPFTLVDHNGKTVTDKDFAGQYRLIYFGFTSCPAICPTELAKVTKALKILGPQAEKIRPLFITVDPERDTPEVLKQYVAMFDPRLVGLTGTQAQIDAALKNYKIFAAKRQDESSTEYTMDHSSFIYFLGPGDELFGIYRTEDTAEQIADDVRKNI